jgi:hypothetical protein
MVHETTVWWDLYSCGMVTHVSHLLPSSSSPILPHFRIASAPHNTMDGRGGTGLDSNDNSAHDLDFLLQNIELGDNNLEIDDISDAHRQQTARQEGKYSQDEDLAAAVLQIIELMNKLDMNLALFLNAVLWGSTELTGNGQAQWQRTCLLTYHSLADLVQRMYRPPARHNQSGGCGEGGRRVLREWVEGVVIERMERELTASTRKFQQPKLIEFLELSSLLSIGYKSLIQYHQIHSPTTWKILSNGCYTLLAEQRNVKPIELKVDTVCRNVDVN